MKLRVYKPEDCEKTLILFYDTVHFVNNADYTEKQLDAWATKDMNPSEWNLKLLKNSYAVIAETDGEIIGFGTADDIGYFDLLYVHKDYQGIGVATAVAGNIEDYLKQKGVKFITADASITAKPFFEKRGYSMEKEQCVECCGQLFINYKMKKEI